MGSSPEFVEFVGQKAGRVPEKSSFSQKCNLLRQYLKEKGGFGDLCLEMTCNTEATANGNGNVAPEILRQKSATTMDLFPMSDKPADCFYRNTAVAARNVRSMDLFPQQAGFVKEDAQKSIDSSNRSNTTPKESQTAQMTIFYAGEVIVFNDFPADKAKELMLLAGKGCLQSQGQVPYVPATGHPTFAAPAVTKPSIEPTNSIPPSSKSGPGFGNNISQERVQPPPQTIASDVPIARRASLHRFLEKRKDRITGKAPYQTGGPPLSLPSKPIENKSWLGLTGQAP